MNKELTQEERMYHSKELVRLADLMENAVDDPRFYKEVARDYRMHAQILYPKRFTKKAVHKVKTIVKNNEEGFIYGHNAQD